MVIFDYIEYSNFLSTGTAGNRIELNARNKTLIIGANGSGKSTVLCAITFALFGKAFRNINKGQMVNSINGKKCVVTIGFHIGLVGYKIVRGIKPNLFEIYVNDVLLDQTAENKDYQNYLETNILKMNYKTFVQVVILGSTSYVPFMKLTTGARREVIDEILDIKIFSIMSKLLKDKINENKETIIYVENQIAVIKAKAESQQRLIQSLSESKESLIESLKAKIVGYQAEITTNQARVETLINEIASMQEQVVQFDELSNKLNIGNTAIAKKQTQIAKLKSDISFFETHDDCVVCKQQIKPEHKQAITQDMSTVIESHTVDQNTLSEAIKKISDKLYVMSDINKQISSKNIEVSTLNSSISMLNRNITSHQAEIDSESKSLGNIDAEKQTLSDLAKQGISLNKDKAETSIVKSVHDMATQLLKDSGIKTAIIKEYLPVINQLINKHLSAMDFFVKFELDENFDEVIKSRFRDEFSYASFSEGEKFRIDMAIMFCWREVARMKNSLNTNILFFDEVLDGVLDVDGVDFFLGFIDSLGADTNCFIISHKTDQISDRFDSVLKFNKVKDFSEMEVV